MSESQTVVALSATASERAGVAADAHFHAGVAALERQQAAPAAMHLRQAVALAPARVDAALYLARALVMLQRLGEAVAQIERALALAPEDALMLDRAGDLFSQCNLHERAAVQFRRAVALCPGNADYRHNLAVSLTFSGDVTEAEREYEACIAAEPRHWRAHLSLSHLRRQTPASNHIARLRALLAAHGAGTSAQVYLNMALAKELEDLGDYPAAFRHLVRGKAAPRSQMGYSSQRDAALFQAIADAFPAVAAGEAGHDTSEPIFVIGMPRSGTTLVERILSSHPQVQSAGELYNFVVAWKRALGGPAFRIFDPGDIARATAIDWPALGRDYLDSTRPLTGDAAHFVDKLPHNFLYAGYIARALPNARIICLRRNPMDTCLGNFRLLFAPESPYFDYSYDLLDTGRYYVRFHRLMAHWQKHFPGRILEVQYEALVADQERVSRELLAFCGLSWDPACLRFEANQAAVATASAGQVRTPIHRGALHRWKQYESELQPLRRLLEDAGIRVDDEVETVPPLA